MEQWTLATAIEQIQSCDFECEAGPLTKNVAWQFIVDAAKIMPKYMPGQGVWFEVTAQAAGKTLAQWVFFYIVGCFMSSDTERRLWNYSLSYDPPAPWHCGKVHFTRISEEKLSLEKPEMVA